MRQGTFVTMPANGAFTMVWSSWRASFVALGNGVAIARVLLDRDIGVAVEVGGDRGELLIERGQLLLRVLQIPVRRIESLQRRDVLGSEVLLPVEFAIIIIDVVLGLLDLRLHVPVVRLERIEIVADDPDLRVGALQREPERRSSKRNSTWPSSTCWLFVTSISLTMPETSVEMPTLSASTYALSVDITLPPVTYQ